MISRLQAQSLLDEFLTKPHLRFHSWESEVIMRGLARELGENEDLWGITGLLHDLDYEKTGEDAVNHGRVTVRILSERGFDIPEMFQAILSHNGEMTGVQRVSKLDFALAAAENSTGLITAYTLMRPDKKLEGVEVKSVLKKFKDKSFAAMVSREKISDIEKAGISFDRFWEIAISEMKQISSKIGF